MKSQLGFADIAILNARIKTMDSAHPCAEAVAVQGNKILLVGTNDEIRRLIGPVTRQIDAGGATVLPGFNDAHVHLFGGSVGLDRLSVFEISGFENLKSSILEYASDHPDEPLLIVEGGDYNIIAEDERLTRHHLDDILPDRPLILFAADHHTAWANTMALERAGILNGRKPASGSLIVMGEDGMALGELREDEAISPVTRLGSTGGRDRLGATTGGSPQRVLDAERQYDMQLLLRGLEYCASHGVTSIQNMDGNLYQLELLDELRKAGRLPVRVRIPFLMTGNKPLSDIADQASVWRARFNTDMLRCDFIKMFMDGVVESETAMFVEEYEHRPGWKGEALFERDFFNEICVEASKLELQLAVHAVGDGAVRMALDGFEHARRMTHKDDMRHRIEHIEIVHPDDISRFSESRVVASMQPIHAPSGDAAEDVLWKKTVGDKRLRHAFAWRTLIEAGAPMVFSSDWPVAAINPMLSIGAAMTRIPMASGLPDQRLPLDQVLYNYTQAGAWAEFMSDRKGMLREGYLADLVVLDRDIDALSHDALLTVQPVLTMCDGQISYMCF